MCRSIFSCTREIWYVEFAKLFLKVRNIDSLPTLISTEEIASALNDFGNRWCKREGVEDNAFKEWKRSIFTIVDKRIHRYKQYVTNHVVNKIQVSHVTIT